MVDHCGDTASRLMVESRMATLCASCYRAFGASREGLRPPAGPPGLYSSPARAEPDAVEQDVMLKRSIEGCSLESG